MGDTKERFKISIIAAMSENLVIGLNNKIPWHIPEDLDRFKQITSGHTVIMGRKTYESIGSKPLNNRLNIVLSNTLKTNLVKVCSDMEKAFNGIPEQEKEVFIIGGETLYSDAIKFADKMYLTIVEEYYRGDAYFPKFDESEWLISKSIQRNGFKYFDSVRNV